MESQKYLQRIEDNKSLILDAERYIWKNPETGFKEWKTHSYLKDAFEKLGLTTHSFDRIPASVAIQSAENGQDRFFKKIPGFYVDFDTGRPGPRIAVFGEMDAKELYETTMNPMTRSLIKVSITDAALAEKRVSVLMGDKVEPRKDWINENVDFTLEDSFKR